MRLRTDDLQYFINEVDRVKIQTGDAVEIRERIKPVMSALVNAGYRSPSEFCRPASDRHLTNPLHIAAPPLTPAGEQLA